MARKIILKEDGLNGTLSTPVGYKYIGYNGINFSEKMGLTISSINSGGLSFSSVLSLGNETDGNDILLTSGDSIKDKDLISDIKLNTSTKRSFNGQGTNQQIINYGTSSYIELGKFDSYTEPFTPLNGIDIVTNEFNTYALIGSVYHGGIELGSYKSNTLIGIYTNSAFIEMADGASASDYMSISSSAVYLNSSIWYVNGPGDIISYKSPTDAATFITSIGSFDKVDRFFFYSKDITAGNAAPHFRTENGSEIKLYKQIEAALANTPNTGDVNTDNLITALKNIIINSGLGSAS